MNSIYNNLIYTCTCVSEIIVKDLKRYKNNFENPHFLLLIHHL